MKCDPNIVIIKTCPKILSSPPSTKFHVYLLSDSKISYITNDIAKLIDKSSATFLSKLNKFSAE